MTGYFGFESRILADKHQKICIAYKINIAEKLVKDITAYVEICSYH